MSHSQYTSIPTYGANKKSFLQRTVQFGSKKITPDFSQAEDPLNDTDFIYQSDSANNTLNPVPNEIPYIQPQASSAYPYSSPAVPYASSTRPFVSQNTGYPSALQNSAYGTPYTPFQNGNSQVFYPAPTAQFNQPQYSVPIANQGVSQSLSSYRVQGYQPTQSFQAQPVNSTAEPFADSRETPPKSKRLFSSKKQKDSGKAFHSIPAVSSTVSVTGKHIPFSDPPAMAHNYGDAVSSYQSYNSPDEYEPLIQHRKITITGIVRFFEIFCIVASFISLASCFLITPVSEFSKNSFFLLAVICVCCVWLRKSHSSFAKVFVSVLYAVLSICVMIRLPNSVFNAVSTPVASQSHDIPATYTETVAPESPESVYIQATPSPAPANNEPTQAQLRLELFMNLWQNNNTAEMVNLIQPSWRNGKSDPAASLFILLANRVPQNYEIEEVSGTETDNSRTITMLSSISKNPKKEPVTYRFMIIMTREGDEWYVDPNSLATNDEISSPSGDEVVVNDSNASGAATPAPRTTVTPAPPADTTLYYNVNGGSYYHIDPNCPSVRNEFLPLTGTFLYSELSSYQSKLQPCLKCGAPIDTLD